jgi:regulator of replication initiation timing
MAIDDDLEALMRKSQAETAELRDQLVAAVAECARLRDETIRLAEELEAVRRGEKVAFRVKKDTPNGQRFSNR